MYVCVWNGGFGGKEGSDPEIATGGAMQEY